MSDSRTISSTTNGKTMAVFDDSLPVAHKLVYDASDNLEYFCEAAVGEATASSVWRIRKFVYTGACHTSTLWADGNANFDNIATDPSTLTYS